MAHGLLRFGKFWGAKSGMADVFSYKECAWLFSGFSSDPTLRLRNDLLHYIYPRSLLHAHCLCPATGMLRSDSGPVLQRPVQTPGSIAPSQTEAITPTQTESITPTQTDSITPTPTPTPARHAQQKI
jgi:hypothetical protein